ncbi:MAG: Na+/H+ antiporter NhaA [Alphaproteobacteria bacterium]|nr:Na+/H+ antiporter NhaA [Alphaproteobacteria bacterium]
MTRLVEPTSTLREFLKLESTAAAALLVAAALAMVAQNSPAAWLYDAIIDLPASIALGPFALNKPLLHWINDGLMAVFFLLVGLEIKREVLEGELTDPAQAVLPVIAALGGMAAPALLFTLINAGNPQNLAGWAVPTATDIAFALGALSLAGPRVPAALKVFLLTLAVADDLGAIGAIALFYTAKLSYGSLLFAGVLIAALAALNVLGVARRGAYLLLGVALWASVLNSGVHATLAGVVLAFAIPLRARDADGQSPLIRLEHELHPWVAFGILPLFGFANAGVHFGDIGVRDLFATLPLGIAFGLLLGKPAGVLAAAWITIRLGFARLPSGVTWRDLMGVACLAGIGFTMSLFIGSLAFDDAPRTAAIRIGVLAGSLLSAGIGLALLRWWPETQPRP